MTPRAHLGPAGGRAALLGLEVLRRLREDGYEGGKSAVYVVVAALRRRDARPMVRLEGMPGEFWQHDIGRVDVCYLDGRS